MGLETPWRHPLRLELSAFGGAADECLQARSSLQWPQQSPHLTFLTVVGEDDNPFPCKTGDPFVCAVRGILGSPWSESKVVCLQNPWDWLVSATFSCKIRQDGSHDSAAGCHPWKGARA